jgi:hypothetical protein
MTDLRKILETLNRIEQESLNANQKSVKQLSALFKPQKTSPQLSGPYPGKNATQGYLVGESDETGYGSKVGDTGADSTSDGVDPDTKSFLESKDAASPVERALLHRIMIQHTGLLAKYGPELIMDAAAKVADFVGDVEEIGSSDVSGWVRQVEDYAKRMQNRYPEPRDVGDALNESAKTTEDVISTAKKKLGDYLADLSKEIKTDSDLKDKIPQDVDKIGPAAKTIVTDNGREIKIHGNEDDGFRITIKNKPHSARFESLDHAIMACEMYMNRKRKMREQVQNEDYLEE